MLKHLIIKNFQSIATASIPLARLTVFVGPSDSGKSAIVRALRTLTANPRGSHYVRGDGPVVVGADFTDCRVTFRRGKSVEYDLEDESGATSYSGFGAGVPPQVSDRLALNSDGQIADQFDAPYLLGLTPSAAGQVLGVITESDSLARAVAYARRSASASSTNAATYLELAQDEDEAAASFAWFQEVAVTAKEAKEAIAAADLASQVAAQARALAATHQAATRLLARDAARELPRLLTEAQSAYTAADIALAREAAARDALGQYRKADGVLTAIEVKAAKLADARREAEAALAQYLEENPTCPTCGTPYTTKSKDFIHAH